VQSNDIADTRRFLAAFGHPLEQVHA